MNRGPGYWLTRLVGGAALWACLMAPECEYKHVAAETGLSNVLLLFLPMEAVDPPSQNAPPVPTVPYHAMLARQADCSVTRLVFDQGNNLVSSYPNYQDYLHQSAALASTADQFKTGCQDPVNGVASQFGVFLGKITSGANVGNYLLATLASHGVQLTTATPAYSIVASTSVSIGDRTLTDTSSTGTADLNGDGIADLIVTAAGFTFANPVGSLTIFLGKTDGTFQAPLTINLPFNAQGFTVDDVNADGKLDIVVAGYADNNHSASHMAVLLGKGDGTFSVPLVGPVTASGSALVTGDFNGDGKKDVATAAGLILLGDGTGNFTVPFAPQFFLSSTLGIAAGDFNKDGHTDLAVTTNQGTVDVYAGTGDGHFNRVASYATIYGAQSISTTDMDGDGNIDLFVGLHSAAAFSADVASVGEFQTLLGVGDGTFAGASALYPTSAPNGLLPVSFDIADLTGDNKPDLVFIDSDAGGPFLSVRAGNGDTTFTRNVKTPITGYASYNGPIVIADLNGDGKSDAVFATTSTGASGLGVAVSLGNGDGSFQTQTTYGIPDVVGSLIAVDINGDGKPDLVFTAGGSPGATPTNATLQVMLNKGDGTFMAPRQIDAKPYQFFVAAADVNGDQKLDLVVTAPGYVYTSIPGSTSLYLGNGDGSFQAPQTLNAGSNPGPVAFADMNHDGKVDLVIAGADASSAGSVSVLRGNGDGTFQAATLTAAGFAYPNSIAIGDLDKDGKLDVVVTECCGLSNTWLLAGNGDGTFAGGAAAPLPLGQGSSYARILDLNGDGYPEVVLVSNNYAIETFRNSGASTLTTTPTSISLTSSLLSIAAGQTLTLTATVSAASGTTLPSGSATFFDGATAIGTVPLDAIGKAVLTTSSLAAGSHVLMATYAGSPLFATSGSSTVTVAVTAGTPDFTVATTPVSGTVTPGTSAATTLTLTASNGFSGTVQLACSGLPTGATCSFSPASVTVNGAAATSNLTISVTSISAVNVASPPGLDRDPFSPTGTLLAEVSVLVSTRRGRKHRPRSSAALAWIGLLVISAASLPGCHHSGTSAGSMPSGGTPAGTYAVTVTATSGATVHSASYTLTVT